MYMDWNTEFNIDIKDVANEVRRIKVESRNYDQTGKNTRKTKGDNYQLNAKNFVKL